MTKTETTQHWLLTMLVAALIAVGCLADVSSVESYAPHFIGFDKLVHVIMYVALTLTLAYDSRHTVRRKSIAWLSVPTTLYGGLIEYLQYALSPVRSGDWFDWLADFVGVILAVCCVRIYYAHHKG